MLALNARRETGKGQHIDISLQECAASMLDHVLVRYFYEGEVARRSGALYWNGAFCLFPCRDGYILLSLAQGWETLVEWLASEGMAGDLAEPRWADPAYRRENIRHIIEVIGRWTAQHTAAELIETAQAMRFPWAKAVTIPELVESPRLRERGFFGTGKLPGSEQEFVYPTAPCRMSASPWHAGEKPPAPGEHNREIYGSLGLSDGELASLAGRGVI